MIPRLNVTMIGALRLLLRGLCGTASTQTTYGLIEGRITDATGGALSGATITVTQPATGFVRTVVSNELGLYRVLNLNPAEYDVTVELSGFEVRVLTTNYSAEYGRAAGAVISAVTKSGTNAFTGPATPSFGTIASMRGTFLMVPGSPASR